MDGKGRWMDNVMIERLWRSLKYECVYLHAFEGGSEARKGIGEWIRFYNERGPIESGRADAGRSIHGPGPVRAGDTPCPDGHPAGGIGSNWITPYLRRQPVQTMGTTSGIIIDVRTRVEFRPALVNRILTEKKEVFFEPSRVSNNYLIERGCGGTLRT